MEEGHVELAIGALQLGLYVNSRWLAGSVVVMKAIGRPIRVVKSDVDRRWGWGWIRQIVGRIAEENRLLRVGGGT